MFNEWRVRFLLEGNGPPLVFVLYEMFFKRTGRKKCRVGEITVVEIVFLWKQEENSRGIPDCKTDHNEPQSEPAARTAVIFGSARKHSSSWHSSPQSIKPCDRALSLSLGSRIPPALPCGSCAMSNRVRQTAKLLLYDCAWAKLAAQESRKFSYIITVENHI